jgi:hypothetical protein
MALLSDASPSNPSDNIVALFSAWVISYYSKQSESSKELIRFAYSARLDRLDANNILSSRA